MLYLLLKWLHILAAIVAVGANVTYGIWLTRAARHLEALPFTLRGIKQIDDRIANPAYGLLLVTGLLMVFVVRLPLTTPWLLTSLEPIRRLLLFQSTTYLLEAHSWASNRGLITHKKSFKSTS